MSDSSPKPRRNLLYWFLGIEQFRELRTAYRQAIKASPSANLGNVQILFAVLISVLPALAPYFGAYYATYDTPTLFIGIATCLAIVFRIRSRIKFSSVREWKRSLRLTHIAVALGCIPIVALVIFHPSALFRLTEFTEGSGSGSAPQITSTRKVLFVLGVAVWAALTEEFVFRGLLISVMRRWKAISSPNLRSVLAILVSASFFSVSHLSSWGPLMSGALFFLGIGFGIAYVAIGELLLPLIIYHAIFDALSLSFAMVSKK